MAREQDESILDKLLMRWKEHLKEGREVPVEDLCTGRPGLVDELRRRIEALRALDPQFNPGWTRMPGEGSTLLPETATLMPSATPPWPSSQSPIPSRRSASCSATFRDLEFHAAGGLGEVFMALGEDMNRIVALKFVKRPRAGDPETRRMFLQEAEITGRLEHPGVVPVYSIGTDDEGHPCYSMRFIRGETLEEEIHRFHHAGIGPAGRGYGLRVLVRRLITVCNTIAYAHSRGVLHRDIKPKNVMLGKYDETLVVDWGLARPFDRTDEARRGGEETLAPISGSEGSATPEVGPVGTPAYMSPEQAGGDSVKIGPASDVYCLGATLYAVLTGRAPVSGKSMVEVLDKVRKGDIVPPAQVSPTAPRALDAVCRKAMAFDPSARYASALELADDLDRWLADEPVSAYRDPWHVRLSRWGRRHRATVGTLTALVATVLLALATITIITDRQKREIRRQYVRAEANFHLAHEAVDTMLGQVGAVDLADIPQMEKVRKGLLDKALAFSKTLASNRDNALPPLDLALAYRRVGDIEEMLGDYPSAEAAYLNSVGVLKPLTETSPDARRELARADVGLSLLRKKSNRFEAAMDAVNEAVDLCKGLLKATPSSADDKKALADALYQKGSLLARMPAGDAEDSNLGWARDEYGEALKLVSRREDPASWARYSNNLAMLQTATGHPDEAEETLRKAKDVLEHLVEDAPAIAGHRWRLARTCTNLAVLLWPSHPDQAEPLDRSALSLLKDLADQFDGVADYAEDLTQTENNLALRLTQRSPAEAQNLFRDALARQTKLADRFQNVPLYRHDLALTYLHLGILLEKTDPDAADRTAYAPALSLLEDLTRRFPDIPSYQDALGRTLYSQSFACYKRHDTESTFRLLDQSIEHHEKALKASPHNPLYGEHVRDCLFTLSKRLVEKPDLPGASRTAERLVDTLPDDPKAQDLAAQILTRCAWIAPATAEAGYKDRAVAVLRKAADKRLLKDVEERIKKIETLLRNKVPRSA